MNSSILYLDEAIEHSSSFIWRIWNSSM